MRIRSFALRIALLTAGVSACVLVAFGAAGLWLIGEISLQRIDTEVRVRALPHLLAPGGGRHWDRFAAVLGYSYGESGFASMVIDREGRVLHATPNWPQWLPASRFPRPGPGMPVISQMPERRGQFRRRLPRDEPPPPPEPGRPIRKPEAFTARSGGEQWRVAVLGTDEITLAVAIDLDEYGAHMRHVRNAFLAVLPLALLLVAGGAWYISRRALRPIRKLTYTAERITAEGLDRRIPLEDEDVEFLRLVTVFNQMMDRLQKSFHQATRFSADAAHELKTPLAILQGELEQALQAAEDGSREQQVYGDLLGEVQRLKGITQKLLLLSRADSGGLTLHLKPVNLSEAVSMMAEDLQVLAPELAIHVDVAPGVIVPADAELLGQILQNLIGNAIKYNRPGGSVGIALAAVGEQARLAVANTGQGIPQEQRERVFERFFRVDRARSRSIEGVGLGLSLAREIAVAHHGDLVLAESRNDYTVFALTLPLTQKTPAQ